MNKIPTFGRSGIPVAGGVPNKPNKPSPTGNVGPGPLDSPKHPKGLERAADAPRHEPSHVGQRNPAHQRKSAP